MRYDSFRLESSRCGDERDRVAQARVLRAAYAAFDRVDITFVDDGAIQADECSAYTGHLEDPRFYAEEHEWTLFLHADLPEHVPDPVPVVQFVLAAVRSRLPQDLGFVHFVQNYIPRSTGMQSAAFRYEWGVTWRDLFRASVAPAQRDVVSYCCNQFAVRRSRKLLRPRAFYSAALAYFTGADSYQRYFPLEKTWGRLYLSCQLT